MTYIYIASFNMLSNVGMKANAYPNPMIPMPSALHKKLGLKCMINDGPKNKNARQNISCPTPSM